MCRNKSAGTPSLLSSSSSPAYAACVKLPQLHKVLLTLFVLCVLIWNAHAGCSGSCGACARRYGCMTPAWGKCCTQFFMHNGRKRSSPSKPDNVIESIIEYIRLKSKVINDQNLMELEDNISGSELDGIIRDMPLDDEVRNSIDDPITYGSLNEGLADGIDEYKHRR